ncbi:MULTISPECIES: hypothetical protein [Microbacterium]|uniref:Uncharacterized protein n=1 Tax=Microbacterium profundi TaxID=450380 RepID=A0ABV3LHS3_9MICO|nr:hypothetical protein [Microbacterium profundi]MCE7482996.1 hypothetical protein [Microbacterium profundi]
MSDPRAIPDEERPFIPEGQIPPKESTDFDADTVESAGSDDADTPQADAGAESGSAPADSRE